MAAPDLTAALAGIFVLWLIIAGIWKTIELIPKIFRKMATLLSRKMGIEIKRPGFLQRKPKKTTSEDTKRNKKKWVKQK